MVAFPVEAFLVVLPYQGVVVAPCQEEVPLDQVDLVVHSNVDQTVVSQKEVPWVDLSSPVVEALSCEVGVGHEGGLDLHGIEEEGDHGNQMAA